MRGFLAGSSRVWTLQEFLLPCRLSFFVEALDPRFLEFVDEVVKAQSKKGLCRCFCKLGRYELVRPFLQLNNQGSSWALGFDLRDEGQNFQHQALSGSFRFMTSTSVLPMKAEAAQGNEEDGIIQVDGDQPDQNLESVSSMDTNVVCTQCHSLPMIRRAQKYACNSSFESSNQTSAIYLVDREAYFGLMQCHSRMMEPLPIGCSKAVEELLGLYAGLRRKRPWRAYDVIVEVGKRNCTVEEDRVLGILGLLGFGSRELSQLRSGKGLPAQIVQLAKVCNPEMLLDMCAMDVRGCFTPRMSWGPAFHDRDDSWLAHVRFPLSHGKLTVQVERQQVTEAGYLKLRAKVVSAYVLPINVLKNTDFLTNYIKPPTHFITIIPPPCSQHIDPSLLYSMSHHVLLSNPTDYSMAFVLLSYIADQQPSNIIKFEFYPPLGEGIILQGYMELPINDVASITPNHSYPFDVNELYGSVSFQVEMVLLGRGLESHKSGETRELIMLCLKSGAAGEEELHKIGMLYSYVHAHKEDEPLYHLDFENTSMKECTVGGFGADLSAHVHINRQRTQSSSSFFKLVKRMISYCIAWLFWRLGMGHTLE